MKYEYTGENGDFRIKNPELTGYLYFPLANEAGVKSCVTPDLGGDSKMSQNTFFMPPVSCENLHNDKSSRNIWCRLNGKTLWSLTGRSAWQQAQMFTEEKEETEAEAGFMYHKVTRISKKLGIKAEITSLVPSSGETVELMKAEIENLSSEVRKMQIITAIPVYGRSADNIRDHRHVTALLHRIQTTEAGILVNPTMTFDERGHQRNTRVYGVFGGNRKERPMGFYPVTEEFIGEGGNLENPKALYERELQIKEPGFYTEGYEALGGLCFEEKLVQPGEKLTFIIVMGYGTDEKELEETAVRFLDEEAFDICLKETRDYWQEKVNVSYQTADKDFNKWMRWVSFQPMLRRIYGCSFLPHHDYGKGGRGWRDLWQDCLALLIMNPDGVRQMLIDNFAGVRMDGTNATIIGAGQGEFIADRNNITRVWMDHGMWPFLTTDLYIRQTGDIGILLEKNTYFKDRVICRGEESDSLWKPLYGEKQKDKSGELYEGTILEHLLIQHLTAFYDVGEHNHMRIRGADWNDALDLAAERGESVAFTTMYGKNMEQLAALLQILEDAGETEAEISGELEILLCEKEELYDSAEQKRQLLMKYCDACRHELSGEKVKISMGRLLENLKKKAEWMKKHIRESEWLVTEKGDGWYNGYYDNSGNRVEGEKNGNVRMMLTSQVFALMSGTATKNQTGEIVKSADKYLYSPEVGGYRLNTDFHEIKMDLGRMFGFAYGHKENGAVFSHMTTMFANALYVCGESKTAYKALHTLYEHCNDFEKSKIYPGVPEYIDAKGRGVYHYLTGAASWMLVTVLTRMFGVRGELGNLAFHPQLLKEQFDSMGNCGISMSFAGRRLQIIYKNQEHLNPQEYKITKMEINGKEYSLSTDDAVMKREDIEALAENESHTITIYLGEKGRTKA